MKTPGKGGAAFALPPSPYLPGRAARPDAAAFDALKTGLHPGLSIAELAASDAFGAGRAAFARGYFWEAHELWEAVWICLPPASAERHLLRGLIQLANAGLKARMGRSGAAARISALADRALREAFLHRRDPVMGLPRGEVEEMENHVRHSAPEGDSAK